MTRKIFLSLLSPGSALTNRLSFAGKFLLLGLIALVAICIALYSLYASLNQTISQSRQELKGLTLIQPLTRAVQLVQQHRGLSSGVLSGVGDLKPARAASENGAEALFAGLENLLPASSRQLEPWQSITANWRRIRANGLQWTRDDNFAAHTRLIEELLQYITAIIDDYGLTADSDLGIFYLTHVSSNSLMNALEHFGQVRAYSVGMLGAKQASEQQKAHIGAMIALLDDDLKPLSAGVGKIMRYSPEIREIIHATYDNFQNSSQQAINEVRSNILSEHFSMRPGEFFASATVAIDSSYAQLHQTLLPTARRLIEARIQRAEETLYFTAGFALLLLLLVAYFMVAIYHGTLGSIKVLSQSVTGFVRGDMQGRVRLETRDELSQIGDSFNEMADELAKLLKARQAVEKALMESEQKFRHLFEDAADPVLLLKAGRFIDCNAATLKLLRYGSKDEFLNCSPPGISPLSQPDGRTSAEKSTEMDVTALREGFNRFEWIHTRHDGSTVPVEVTLTRIIVNGEAILHVYWRDITERKQAEESLRKLSLAVEQSPDSIVITDLDANIEYVNQAFTKETGYSLVEAVGQNPRLLNSGKNPKAIYDEMWACLTRDEVWKGELINRRKDGSEYIESALISPVHQADGRITHYLAIKENITGRKHSEAQIERLTRTYHLLSRVNEAIVRVQSRDELFATICNVAVESGLLHFAWIGMLDEKRNSVIPVAYAGVEEGYINKLDIRLDDERTGSGPTGKAIRGGAYVVCQDIENDPAMTPWRDEALRRGYRASAVFPIHDAGSAVGAVNVYAAEVNFFTPDIIQLMQELAADVSFALGVFAEKVRRKSAEDGLRLLSIKLESRVAERTRQLEIANKELESFSYSVSHDLRAPLRSIDGFSQILLKKYHDQLDETGKDYLERVRRASQRMGHLIDDMLQLSRVTRGTLKREEVDLSKMAGDVAEDLRNSHPQRKAQFVLQQGLVAYADPGLLRIALDNLLGNAYKYTGKKPEAKIEFGMCDVDEGRAFFVRDNGAGFNMEHAHKLFGAFQRLHGVDEFEGTGVGLATVQRIIQRHHGKVWAEATEGQGAAFYFTLPQRERDMGSA
ncbi:MAG: PAS domain S-box protein [Gallionellaceae bacterium]|nr:PAS domain S-box protein [Gallionellaceae bacterium]